MLGALRYASIDILQCRRYIIDKCISSPRLRRLALHDSRGVGQRMLASDTCSLGLSTRHHYSTNAPSASASLLRDWGKHSIFVSLSDDPYFNLSVEDLYVHDSYPTTSSPTPFNCFSIELNTGRCMIRVETGKWKMHELTGDERTGCFADTMLEDPCC